MTFTKDDWRAATAAVESIEKERKALLAPTEERYDAALDRLEEIEEDLPDTVGKCEGCGCMIFEDDPYLYSHIDSVSTCLGCSPTWADMVEGFESWINTETDDPMTQEEAQAWADRHVAAGGKLTDSMARVRK